MQMRHPIVGVHKIQYLSIGWLPLKHTNGKNIWSSEEEKIKISNHKGEYRKSYYVL